MNRHSLRLSTLTIGGAALLVTSCWIGSVTRRAKAADASPAETAPAAEAVQQKVSLVFSVNNYGYTGTCG